MSRRQQRLLVLVLALAAFLLPAATAYAVWSTSATAAMTANTVAVSAPTVSCSGSNQAITLSWTASSGATGYTVYRKVDATTLNEADTTTSTSLLLNEASMGSPTIASGKYDVIVRASNGGGTADSAVFKLQFKGSCAQ